MANNGLDTRYRRTKCSGTRKGPQFRSWIWCILLKCLISFPCIFSKCLGVDITVGVYPPGDITVRYGDPLEIFCLADNNYTADDIEFTLAGKLLESEKVNTTTRRLYIAKPEIQAKSYYCKNRKTGKICTSRVLVDSLPVNVTDFNCISKNLDVLNCSWTYPETKSNVNFSNTFDIHGTKVKWCRAEKIENTNTRFCMWNTTSSPRYRQQEIEQHFFLRSCNVFGCNDQNFTIDHFSIVKPDSPIDLKVVKNGTHSVVLKWDIPNNIVDFLTCGVDHIIEYQIAKIDNNTEFHEVDTSSLPPKNKTYRFPLTNLPYANMQYAVRVYIKSKKAVKKEYWSKFSSYLFHTYSEKPQRPPDMIAGGFDQSSYKNSRVVYIYWKQLEEYEEAGANFTYKVLITQRNTSQTVFPDKNKSLSYVILDNASLDAIEATVWSFNIEGSSENSSHLYIPPLSDTTSLRLTSFTKIAYENGTYALSWVGIQNVDNYTLFWCQHNNTQICSGRMSFAVINSKKINHVINLPREHRYQFAISVNNGTKTSGMVWAKCDISKDGFAMYGFPMHLNYDAPQKSSVTLRWVMDCALEDGIIIGYNITYCPVVRTSSNCDKSVKAKYEYIPNPKQKQVTIKNLLPFRTYQFNFSLETKYGQKNIENATAVITTSEDTPTSPINILISDVQNDSLVISWDPPIHRNGNIGKYVIKNFGKEIYAVEVSGPDDTRRNVTLKDLRSFTNYSLTVQACNINPIFSCSGIGPNDGLFVRTRIGTPGRLRAPTVNNNPDLLQWEPPTIPGGTVDKYEIRRIRDNLKEEILNTTNLSYALAHCEEVVSTETYQVRAVNFDDDYNHGVITVKGNVTIPTRDANDTLREYPGEWSEPSTVACRSKDGLMMIYILMGIFAIIVMVYGSVKFYKKYRKMEDIKPVLPNGLGIPEKDISKYTFGGWNPSNKDEKPSSDEMLLLPNSKTVVSSPELKQKDDTCGGSDHTDSTVLSDSSRGPVDRQASTSDDGSNSSLNLEVEPVKSDENNGIQEEESSTAETESSRESSPYFNERTFKKNPASGYVQPVVSPTTGYVQSAPAPTKIAPQVAPSQPASSSYVMAGLSPPIFTTGVALPTVTNPATSSGYVLPEEARSMNFPKLGPSPTKVIGPESLPTVMPILPPLAKHGADSSYIQLQSLDALPSLKTSVRNTVPLKPPTSSGYVSPGDVVINKHLNNMLNAGQLAEESAILDPTMSPDAYCRFSWSTDPANDNLHSLFADSPSRNSSKN